MGEARRKKKPETEIGTETGTKMRTWVLTEPWTEIEIEIEIRDETETGTGMKFGRDGVDPSDGAGAAVHVGAAAATAAGVDSSFGLHASHPNLAYPCPTPDLAPVPAVSPPR